jgi:hypothetical protein
MRTPTVYEDIKVKIPGPKMAIITRPPCYKLTVITNLSKVPTGEMPLICCTKGVILVALVLQTLAAQKSLREMHTLCPTRTRVEKGHHMSFSVRGFGNEVTSPGYPSPSSDYVVVRFCLFPLIFRITWQTLPLSCLHLCSHFLYFYQINRNCKLQLIAVPHHLQKPIQLHRQHHNQPFLLQPHRSQL